MLRAGVGVGVWPPSTVTGRRAADKTAPGVFEESFNAQQYIALGTTTNPTGVQATLDREGWAGLEGCLRRRSSFGPAIG